MVGGPSDSGEPAQVSSVRGNCSSIRLWRATWSNSAISSSARMRAKSCSVGVLPVGAGTTMELPSGIAATKVPESDATRCTLGGRLSLTAWVTSFASPSSIPLAKASSWAALITTSRSRTIFPLSRSSSSRLARGMDTPARASRLPITANGMDRIARPKIRMRAPKTTKVQVARDMHAYCRTLIPLGVRSIPRSANQGTLH